MMPVVAGSNAVAGAGGDSGEHGLPGVIRHYSSRRLVLSEGRCHVVTSLPHCDVTASVAAGALASSAAASTADPEDVISKTYLSEFENCLNRAYWITARRILETVLGLNYHGPKATEFRCSFEEMVRVMPNVPAKTRLSIFLANPEFLRNDTEEEQGASLLQRKAMHGKPKPPETTEE